MRQRAANQADSQTAIGNKKATANRRQNPFPGVADVFPLT